MDPTAASRVLIVEDEPKLARLLGEYLEAAGFAVEIVADGREVVPKVKREAPDLMLLDLMLPGIDGYTVCREIRAFSELPIIMVTARVEEVDRLLGLAIGADDYVCKPFSPREVVARVKAVLRRADPAERARSAARLVLDRERVDASLDGRPLALTPAEFRLLAALASREGRVFSRQELLDQMHDDSRVVTDRTIDSHIKNLRRKLEAVVPDEDAIRSVYGMGYKLEL